MRGAHEMPGRWLVALSLTVPLLDCLAPVKVSKNHRTVDSRPCSNVWRGCHPSSSRISVGSMRSDGRSRAVAYQGDQARGSALGAELIHQGADRLQQLAVLAFPAASYAVAGAESPACC